MHETENAKNWQVILSVYAKHPVSALNLAEEFSILKEFLQQGKSLRVTQHAPDF
jgi:hypothetical protein